MVYVIVSLIPSNLELLLTSLCNLLAERRNKSISINIKRFILTYFL
nr:MAG TPA: hypothetical protein [Caudoviricetes sp.]